ncbi:MAG: hypothetical protein U0640_10295 [Phycisphaerales bacterium]
MKFTLLNILSMLVLLGLAVLFGMSSVMKAMDVESFETIVEAHGVLPKGIVPFASIMVIVVEGILAILCVSAVLLELTTSKPVLNDTSAAGQTGGLTSANRAKLSKLTMWALVSAGTLLTLFMLYALTLAILTKEPVECGCSVFGKTVVLPKWIAIRSGVSAGLVFGVVAALRKQRATSHL